MLLTISVVNKHMVSHKRSITAEIESNTSFLNPIERICFQICSIGFISGVYGGIERSCIFSGQRNAFDLCHAAPSHTNRIISSGYCSESFSRNILVHSVSQFGIVKKKLLRLEVLLPKRIAVFPYVMTRHRWPLSSRTPASFRLIDPPKPCFIFKHQPDGFGLVLGLGIQHTGFNFFEASQASSSAAFGCLERGIFLLQPCLFNTL